MIGIDPFTGKTLDGFAQFKSRFQQVVTTMIGTRQKKPNFGCLAPSRQGKNLNQIVINQMQNDVLDAVGSPDNGLSDFSISQCKITVNQSGSAFAAISGRWRNKAVEFEVNLNGTSTAT
ncbi:MAG: hypothetical protein OIF58_15770 [Cohaesibacter sp.]|nr:hypothetical protein [Cohaesibacter sp.]